MAKAAEKVVVKNREDADWALKMLGSLDDAISQTEMREREVIRQAEDRMVKETKDWRQRRDFLARDLERWARENEREWEGRTLELMFGKIFFRMGSGAIRLVRSIEYVLARLRAKKMTSCIRTKEEVDKAALEAYDNAVLKEIGCKREKPDYFHYEVFKPEVK